MQKGWRHQRHNWGIIGVSLIIGAFVTLAFAYFHVRELPSPPSDCSVFDCNDAIYDLRGPYSWVTLGAAIAGFLGFIVLTGARPIRWTKYTAPARGWSAVWRVLIFLPVLAVGLLPWPVFLLVRPTDTPKMALVAFLISIVVHLALWWWLRRQTGRDRGAWVAALIVQSSVAILMVPIVLVALSTTAVFIPLAQAAFFLRGMSVAARDLTAHSGRLPEDAPPSSKAQRISAGAFVTVGVIALATVCASLPLPVPEHLQQRLDNGPIHTKRQNAR